MSRNKSKQMRQSPIKRQKIMMELFGRGQWIREPRLEKKVLLDRKSGHFFFLFLFCLMNISKKKERARGLEYGVKTHGEVVQIQWGLKNDSGFVSTFLISWQQIREVFSFLIFLYNRTLKKNSAVLKFGKMRIIIN